MKVTYKRLLCAAYAEEERLQTRWSSPAVRSPGHTDPDRGRRVNTGETWLLFPFSSVSESIFPPSSYRFPLIHVWQEHFTIAGNVVSGEDEHLWRGFDVADGSSLGVAFL